MKPAKFILALALIGWGLTSCGKDVPTPNGEVREKVVSPLDNIKKRPQDSAPTTGHKGKKEEPKSDVELAYESLKLKKLEIDSLSLPPLPERVTDKLYIGRDSLWRKHKAWCDDYYKEHGEYPMISPSNVSKYMIWAYAIPNKITIGNSAKHAGMVNTDEPNYKEEYKESTFLPLTFGFSRYSGSGWCSEISKQSWEIQAFDSLSRLHHVKPGKESMQPHTPTPYDLRKMVIAHDGIDISPLFSIRYSDYREVAPTDDYTRVNVVDKRVSEVTTNELDWLYGGFFWVKPLTNRYTQFTVIFITVDGRIIEREIQFPFR